MAQKPVLGVIFFSYVSTRVANKQRGMIYQELARRDDSAAEEVFFELANEHVVSYRVNNAAASVVTVTQDADIQDSTGGIVWETAYLLATYLEAMAGARPGDTVLEVGAGCGLLGLVLAHHGCQVTATECAATLPVLEKNVVAAARSVKAAGGRARAKLLRWEEPGDRMALGAPTGGFDLVVGTDVFFDAALVAPLLDTVMSLLAPGGAVYLCFQERCAASHAELLKLAPQRFEEVRNLSAELAATKGCAAAGALDCWLLRLSAPRGGGGGSGGGGGAGGQTSYAPALAQKVAKSEAKAQPVAGPGLAAGPGPVAVKAGTAPSWMSAAFARAMGRAEPDADVASALEEDENFDGRAVAAFAGAWYEAQGAGPGAMAAGAMAAGAMAAGELVAAAAVGSGSGRKRAREVAKDGGGSGAAAGVAAWPGDSDSGSACEKQKKQKKEKKKKKKKKLDTKPDE